MKVLGFPKGRINGYVFWECMIMCTIGLVIGTVIGGPLGNFLSRAIEIEMLQDIRGINLNACMYGAVINFVFFTIANLLSLRNIRKIKMTGSAREA